MTKIKNLIKKILKFARLSGSNWLGRKMYREWTPKIVLLFSHIFKPKPGKITSLGSGTVANLQFLLLRNQIEKYQGYKLRRYNNYFGNNIIKKIFIIPYDIVTSELIIVEDVSRLQKLLKHDGSRSVIQMWHALGAFKVFGFCNADGLTRLDGQQLDEMKLAYWYDYCLDPGKKFRQDYIDSFSPGCQIIKGIFNPRVDLLFDQAHIKEATTKIYDAYPQLKNKKVLLYAPTYRGLAMKQGSEHFMNFDKVLSKLPDEYLLVLKRHPSMKNSEITLPSPKYIDKFVDASAFNVNDLMQIATTLINDYSSTVFEASILGLPSVFFAPDLEDYIDDRGFYHEYRSFVPGPISQNEDDLVRDILEYGEDKQRPINFVNEYFGEIPKNNSELFAEYLVDKINAKHPKLVEKCDKQLISLIDEVQEKRKVNAKQRTESKVLNKELKLLIELESQNKGTFKADKSEIKTLEKKIAVKKRLISQQETEIKKLTKTIEKLKK